jgi:hypothetical protein
MTNVQTNVITTILNNLFNLTLSKVVRVLLQKKIIICIYVYLVQACTSGDPKITKLLYYSLSLFSSIYINNIFLFTVTNTMPNSTMNLLTVIAKKDKKLSLCKANNSYFTPTYRHISFSIKQNLDCVSKVVIQPPYVTIFCFIYYLYITKQYLFSNTILQQHKHNEYTY